MPPYLRLKYERHRRGQGWSQAHVGHLAKQVGGLDRPLHQNEVSEIESGRRIPDDDELEALGRVFEISPAAVLLRPVTVRDPEEQAV